MSARRSRWSCRRRCESAIPIFIFRSLDLYHQFVSQCSQSSNLLNQARLKTLQAQQQHIQNLLAEARVRLGKASADRNNYSRVIRDLIIQALFQVFFFFLSLCLCCFINQSIVSIDHGANGDHQMPRSRFGSGGKCPARSHRQVLGGYAQAVLHLGGQGQLPVGGRVSSPDCNNSTTGFSNVFLFSLGAVVWSCRPSTAASASTTRWRTDWK